MALQYTGGPNINNTFTNTTGTRQEIVTGLQNALVAAGWTVISGSGTSNVLIESATTPAPQSLVCRVNLQDPGSGNCAQVKFRNQANSKSQTNFHPLFPQASKVWRIIANKYQFFIFSTASTSVGREFVCGGVPYLPSFLQGVITEAIWSHSNGGSDTDTAVRSSFRTNLTLGVQNNHGTIWNTCNLNQWENYSTQINNLTTGWPLLSSQVGALYQQNAGTTLFPTYTWHDDSLLTYEPLIGWGLTGYGDTNKFRGQLWDAAIVGDSFAADVTTTFDSRNWWNITYNNSGATSAYARGSLLIVVP
jgi:hypothetical protein